jgi:malate/lactate dehydrogenase
VPAILGSDGVEAVLELPLSSNEILELHHSADTLEATYNELGL